MGACLFCEIAAGRIPADIVHQDEEFVAFRDIDPKAPSHVLVVPRRHLAGLNDLVGPERSAADGLLGAGVIAAHAEGLAPGGYRFVINCGQDGGQAVGHLHLRGLGGRPLGWPPG
ncbi:HIT domain-containing protein [bacterium]|nr:HIT domain-containing protein [bacterium]